ncbi:MAG: hypothetical protein BGO98_44735 [Myxococcales bacterium 68-20]|nr:MAG: hypothetical protein BGO98_44735 [Myxococcales bacterium 68-20]
MGALRERAARACAAELHWTAPAIEPTPRDRARSLVECLEREWTTATEHGRSSNVLRPRARVDDRDRARPLVECVAPSSASG